MAVKREWELYKTPGKRNGCMVLRSRYGGLGSLGSLGSPDGLDGLDGLDDPDWFCRATQKQAPGLPGACFNRNQWV